MKQEQFLSLFRHLLSGVGGLLIAYGIGNESLIMEIGGGLSSLVALVWSFLDKSITVTRFEGLLRHVLTTIGTFAAILTPELQQQILSVLVAVVPIVLGQLDKFKVQEPLPAPMPVDDAVNESPL